MFPQRLIVSCTSEVLVELLERSRYIVCKMQPDWEEDEKEMMEHLFSSYPVLRTAYDLTQQLRLWYNGRNVGKNLRTLEMELYTWCDRVSHSKIPAFRGVRKMIEQHQDDILQGYFF